MRGIAAGLAALLLVAGLAGPASAQTQSEKEKRYAKRSAQPPAEGRSNGYAGRQRDSGYTEQLADKQPFGSSAWWEMMRREGRLGGETP